MRKKKIPVAFYQMEGINGHVSFENGYMKEEEEESTTATTASTTTTTTTTPNTTPTNQSHKWSEQFRELYTLDNDPGRAIFLDNLFYFLHRKGKPVTRIPVMAKQVLDLYNLFKLVVERGGLVAVIEKKIWREITKGLDLPSSITSAAFTLRTQYMKFLYSYECELNNFSTSEQLQQAIDGNRREGRSCSNFSSGEEDGIEYYGGDQCLDLSKSKRKSCNSININNNNNNINNNNNNNIHSNINNNNNNININSNDNNNIDISSFNIESEPIPTGIAPPTKLPVTININNIVYSGYLFPQNQ